MTEAVGPCQFTFDNGNRWSCSCFTNHINNNTCITCSYEESFHQIIIDKDISNNQFCLKKFIYVEKKIQKIHRIFTEYPVDIRLIKSAKNFNIRSTGYSVDIRRILFNGYNL